MVRTLSVDLIALRLKLGSDNCQSRLALTCEKCGRGPICMIPCTRTHRVEEAGGVAYIRSLDMVYRHCMLLSLLHVQCELRADCCRAALRQTGRKSEWVFLSIKGTTAYRLMFDHLYKTAAVLSQLVES